MDAIDRKILAVLQEDASLSVAEIGKRVGLSSTPVLEAHPAARSRGRDPEARRAWSTRTRSGSASRCSSRSRPATIRRTGSARFAEAVRAMPEVMEFYRMAGDVDYMLRVVGRQTSRTTTASTSG